MGFLLKINSWEGIEYIELKKPISGSNNNQLAGINVLLAIKYFRKKTILNIINKTIKLIKTALEINLEKLNSLLFLSKYPLTTASAVLMDATMLTTPIKEMKIANMP